MNAGIPARHGKGGMARNVFIGEKTRKALRAYLRHRTDREAALFPSRDGERVSRDALRLMLNRRAFALHMLRNGADVFALQKLLGHSDLQSSGARWHKIIKTRNWRICEGAGG